jgi:hypothetical protein
VRERDTVRKSGRGDKEKRGKEREREREREREKKGRKTVKMNSMIKPK